MKVTTLAISALLLFSLIGASAQAVYSIEPAVKGWAVKNPMNESYTFAIVHDGTTDNPVVVTAKPIVYTDEEMEENETFFTQLPKDLRSYITITPDVLTIDKGETGYFKVFISFPDLPQIYNKTYEVRFLVNDTNPYNAGTNSQQIHTLRLFMPDGPPPTPPEPTPLYVYIGAGVVFLLLIIGVIQLLRKRTLSVARQDTPLSENEWRPLASERALEKGKEPNPTVPVVDAIAQPLPPPAIKLQKVVKPTGTLVPYKRKVKT